MRCYNKDDKDDRKELKALAPEPWMVELLAMNPDYCSWGPHEDYMIGDDKGWASRVLVEGWENHGFALDDLNECVNFYFEIARPSKNCETCAGEGVHPDAQWVTESFYRHSSPFTVETQHERDVTAALARLGGERSERLHGRGNYPAEAVLKKYGKAFREFCKEMRTYGSWSGRITEDEFAALKKEKRDWGQTREQFNAGQGHKHDAINRWILIEQRLKRLGLPHKCPDCKGTGSHYIAPSHVNLVLWILHPRKGCSRGVEISKIKETDLPEVFKYLRHAAQRNADRFGKIPG